MRKIVSGDIESISSGGLSAKDRQGRRTGNLPRGHRRRGGGAGGAPPPLHPLHPPRGAGRDGENAAAGGRVAAGQYLHCTETFS